MQMIATIQVPLCVYNHVASRQPKHISTYRLKMDRPGWPNIAIEKENVRLATPIVLLCSGGVGRGDNLEWSNAHSQQHEDFRIRGESDQ
ncbi:hypothetical protein OUZ56_022772 [Daphnia magna]|uniref:Uncharacterized protein n=1 Tax=Daphnia magna TaxID=35525 RepID=A0ABR0AXF0_9CRUS|nr:hypothetical protein OUZ56_022772 [Daphnia magna]